MRTQCKQHGAAVTDLSALEQPAAVCVKAAAAQRAVADHVVLGGGLGVAPDVVQQPLDLVLRGNLRRSCTLSDVVSLRR